MRSRWVALAFCAPALLAAACSPEPLQLAESRSELTSIVAGNGGNFGDVQVGATSGAMLIRVYPSGAGESFDTISEIKETCTNFSVAPMGLPAEVSKSCSGGGGQLPRIAAKAGDAQPAALPICDTYEVIDYTFPAYFSPTVAGSQSCVITVIISGESRTLTVTGNGLPPPREIELSRTSIAFGEVRSGTASMEQTLTVSNTGSSELLINGAALLGANAGKFALRGATSLGLAGGASYPYGVTCNPAASDLGDLTATLRISSNDPDEPQLDVPLTCKGVSSALAISPSPLSFSARVGEPQEVTFTLQNAGNLAMDLKSLALDGEELEIQLPRLGNIPAGGSVQGKVRYLAKTERAMGGAITIKFDDKTQQLLVSAQAKLAALALDPDGTVNLGAICVGNSVDRTFGALATGGAGFRIASVQSEGSGFAIVGAAGPFDLRGGGGTTSFKVRAAPTVAGPLAGAVTLATDIPGEATRRVTLTGSAIAAGVGAAPDSFDFGSMLVNEPTDVQRFSLANCSGGPLTISSVAIGGTDAADFRVVEQPMGGSLAVGATTSFPVEMRPRTPGAKAATVIVTHSAGVTEIPLLGDGFLPPQPVEEVGTYYSCSTGTPAGGMLLVLAALGLVVRRRARR